MLKSQSMAKAKGALSSEDVLEMTNDQLDVTFAIVAKEKEKRGPGRPPKPANASKATTDPKVAAAPKGAAAAAAKNRGKNNRTYADVAAPKRATNAQLNKLVEELRAEVDQLKNELKAVQSARSAPTATQTLRTVNSAANDTKERERRSKNIIVRGIAPNDDGDTREHDDVQIEAFLDIVCNGAKAKSVHRLHTSKTNDASKPAPVPSILVVLETTEVQQQVLRAARHHSNADFAGVFAHEDRTKSQQLQYSDMSKKAKAENEKLKRDKLLDQPFRFVVRGDRVRCIDALKSADNKKSVYVTDQQLKEYISNIKQVGKVVNSGSVTTRASTVPVTKAPAEAQAATQH